MHELLHVLAVLATVIVCVYLGMKLVGILDGAE